MTELDQYAIDERVEDMVAPDGTRYQVAAVDNAALYAIVDSENTKVELSEIGRFTAPDLAMKECRRLLTALYADAQKSVSKTEHSKTSKETVKKIESDSGAIKVKAKGE